MWLLCGVEMVLSTLIRFQTKADMFCSVFKKIASTLIVFVLFSPIHTTTPYPFWKRFYTFRAHAQMNSTHAHFNISAREIEATWHRLSANLDTYGGVIWCPVVSILMTSPFSDSIVFSVHTRKQRFQKASFSNRFTLDSVFEWLRFRRSLSAL